MAPPPMPPTTDDPTPERRGTYEAPRIEESASFERLVLACGHEPGNEGQGGPCDPLDGGSAQS